MKRESRQSIATYSVVFAFELAIVNKMKLDYVNGCEALYTVSHLIINPAMVALGISLIGLLLISVYTYATIKKRDNI